MLLLDNTASPALSLTGGGSLTVYGSVLVNSTSLQAINISGSSTFKAAELDLSGGYNSISASLLPATVLTGVSPVADPFRKFPIPQTADYPLRTYTGGSQVLQPGVYVGGITITGSDAVTMQPGVYMLTGGGLEVWNSATLTGSGVMVYNTGSDEFSFNGSGAISLSAPTSGTYQGICLFQARTATQTMLVRGGGSVQVQGAVYLAGAGISMSGNGSGNSIGTLVARTLSIDGTGSVTVDPGTNRPQIPECGLVE